MSIEELLEAGARLCAEGRALIARLTRRPIETGSAESPPKLAEEHERKGHLKSAVIELERAAIVSEQSGRSERACALWRRIARLDPEHVPARLRLAEVSLALGRRTEGLGWLRESLDVLRAHKRIDEWLVVARQLLRYDPTNQDLARTVARICFHRGDTAGAAEVVEAHFHTTVPIVLKEIAEPSTDTPFGSLLAEALAALPTEQMRTYDPLLQIENDLERIHPPATRLRVLVADLTL
jgi:hypothetical protein